MKIEPADLPTILGGVLDEVAAVLESLGIRHALVGGLAVGIHTQARATKDIDLAVAVDAASAEQLVAAMAERELVARVHGRLGPGAVIRFSRTGADGIVRWVDMLCAGTPFEERALGRASVHRVLGRELPVVSVEDLLVYKLLAGRPQDVADAVRLIQEHGARLDRPYLERACDEWEIRGDLARIEQLAEA